jgi:hypothetical protein
MAEDINFLSNRERRRSVLKRRAQVQQHVKILAILNIVWGGLLVVAAVIVFAVMGGVAGLISRDVTGDAQAAPVVGFIGLCVAVFLLVLSAPSIIAGVGLLKFQPWARILTIILSALHLLNIPFGTALGIYGLWVLLNAQTEPLFRQGPPVRLPYTPPPAPSGSAP